MGQGSGEKREERRLLQKGGAAFIRAWHQGRIQCDQEAAGWSMESWEGGHWGGMLER